MSVVLHADSRPRRVPARISRSSDGGRAVVLVERGRRHALNSTALALWQLCDGLTSVREMEAAVEELFGLPEHQAHAQVLSALRTMGGAGLVRWA